MAYGVAPPALGEWIINLGEAAEYMFDQDSDVVEMAWDPILRWPHQCWRNQL